MYELVSPVRLNVLIKHFSRLAMGAGILFILPLFAALADGEVFVSGICALLFILVFFTGFCINSFLPESELEMKEAIVLAAVVFPFLALIFTLPVMFLTGMSFVDAFFETVSAVTTTGLSVSSPDAGPVFLFTRSWLQWVGGIGILIIAVFIFLNPGASAYRLYSVNLGKKKIRPTVFATSEIIFLVYAVITAAAFILLFAGGMNFFDALCHSLSSVSTGGFSTNALSISGFTETSIPVLITISSIMGAVNFGLYSQSKKNIRNFFGDIQIRYFFIFSLISIIFLIFTLYGSDSIENIISISLFQTFSALTTSGFVTIDPALLPESSKIVLSVTMWAGGSMGSTAGGIKIIRLIILLKIVHVVFIRFFLPKEALTPLKIRDEVIDFDMVCNIVCYIFLYFLIIIISCFIFMSYGFEPADSLFEISSAIGTVGMSCGITDASMPLLLKFVLIGDMLLGRIEILPLFILLFPRTWVKNRGV